MGFQELQKLVEKFLSAAKRPLLVVVGPTASGKTKLAVSLAKQFNGEVINADSRQIYQEIEVGNALTTPAEMEGIPHHLFSAFPLSEAFSVADYKDLAEEAIEGVLRRKKLPILCGGTLMWIDAVVDNFTIPKAKANAELRAKLEHMTADELLSELNRVDPESADKFLKEKNKRYIIRALEIYHQTGETKSKTANKGKRIYEVLKVAPVVDRETLYQRINERTEKQLNSGMIEEVKHLVEKYGDGDPKKLLELGWPGLSSIGCKELIPFLLGQIDRGQVLERLQQHNRNYAKRQLTWLRKDREVNWIEL